MYQKFLRYAFLLGLPAMTGCSHMPVTSMVKLARLKAFRSELIARKSSGQKGSISISVRPQACKVGDLAEGPVFFTTYLRTAETLDYVPLARDVDLRSIVPDAAVAGIPRCGP